MNYRIVLPTLKPEPYAVRIEDHTTIKRHGEDVVYALVMAPSGRLGAIWVTPTCWNNHFKAGEPLKRGDYVNVAVDAVRWM